MIIFTIKRTNVFSTYTGHDNTEQTYLTLSDCGFELLSVTGRVEGFSNRGVEGCLSVPVISGSSLGKEIVGVSSTGGVADFSPIRGLSSFSCSVGADVLLSVDGCNSCSCDSVVSSPAGTVCSWGSGESAGAFSVLSGSEGVSLSTGLSSSFGLLSGEHVVSGSEVEGDNNSGVEGDSLGEVVHNFSGSASPDLSFSLLGSVLGGRGRGEGLGDALGVTGFSSVEPSRCSSSAGALASVGGGLCSFSLFLSGASLIVRSGRSCGEGVRVNADGGRRGDFDSGGGCCSYMYIGQSNKE